jgi:hypothetical protein
MMIVLVLDRGITFESFPPTGRWSHGFSSAVLSYIKFDPAEYVISSSFSTLGQFCAVFKGFIQPQVSGIHSFKVSGLNSVASALTTFFVRFDGFLIERVSIASPNFAFSSSMNTAMLYEISMEFCSFSMLLSSFEIQWQPPLASSFSSIDSMFLYTNGTVLSSNHVKVLPHVPDNFYPSSNLITQITSGIPTTFYFSSLDKFGNIPISCNEEDFLVILLRNPRFSSRNVLCSVTFQLNSPSCDIAAACIPTLLSHSREENHDWKLKVVSTLETGLWATYYSSTSLTSPVATRLAASIDFSGSSLSSQPVSSLASGEGWSVRWSGFVRAPVAGGATWTFFVGLAQGGNGGDGVRGWVDGVAVVNAWGGVSGSEVSGTVVLSGASNSYYEVVVEYKAVGAAYGCSLSWSESTFLKQVIRNVASGGSFSHAEYHIRSLSGSGSCFV